MLPSKNHNCKKLKTYCDFFVRFWYVCRFKYISLSAQITMLTSFNVFIAHKEFWPKKLETTKLLKLRRRPTMMLKITKNQSQKPFFRPSFKKYRSGIKIFKKYNIMYNIILNRFVKVEKLRPIFCQRKIQKHFFSIHDWKFYCISIFLDEKWG